jgi:hypothetical protein
METKHHIVRKRIAAAAGFLFIAAPTVVNADTPTHRELCPAADTVPMCDLPSVANRSRFEGVAVSERPAQVKVSDGTDILDIDCTLWLRGPIALCGW